MNIEKPKKGEQAIIINSLKLFRQQSFHNTSMEDIAKSCGILKGSLYHYFKSKEDLMFRVISFVHLYFKEEVFVHAYNDKISAKQKLKKLCDASELVFFDKKTGKLYGNIGVESALVVPEFNPIIKEFFQDFFNALKHIYKEKYGEKIANELAERSVAEVEGSIMLARIFNDKTYITNTHKRIIARLE
jgi:TetR/AcrR family transcriptional repressor of nem operon